MNYEQLYAYLDSRPLEEVKECMDNLGNLVRKHDDKFAGVEKVDRPNKSPTVALQQLHMAQQVWTQQAVWNKFGTEARKEMSSSEVAEAVSHLFTTKEAAQYIVDVTKQIDEEANQTKSQLKGTSPAQASSTLSSDISHGLPLTSPYHGQQRQESALQTNVRVGSKRKFEGKHPGHPSIWNDEMDAALVAAVTAHKEKGWDYVAEQMKGRASGNQCCERWNHYLSPKLNGLKTRVAWAEDELRTLENLVRKHTVESYWSEGMKAMTQQRVDWQAIGKELNRVPRECRQKWQPIALAKKKNAFTAQDDVLILRREKEWGNKGVGLWASLEKELKRPEWNIRRRWKELFF